MLRKFYELIVKIFILNFLNHVFENDFSPYIAWNKSKKLANLDTWIHNEKVSVLKAFFIQLMNKYQ